MRGCRLREVVAKGGSTVVWKISGFNGIPTHDLCDTGQRCSASPTELSTELPSQLEADIRRGNRWSFIMPYLGANRFPKTWENGIQSSSFRFRLPTTSEMGIQIFKFFFVFPVHWKRNWNYYFSFFVLPSLKGIAMAISVFHLLFSYGI